MSTTPVWACWDKLLPTVRLYVKESYKSLLSLDLWDGHCIQSLGESYTMFRLPDTRPMIPVPSSRVAKLYRSNTNATQVGLSPSGRKALQRTLKESSKWRIDNQGHANFLEDLCTFWSTPLGRIEGGDENLWSQVHIVPGFDRESKCLIIKWRGFDSWYWTVFFFGVPISVRNVNGGAILYLPKSTYRERFSYRSSRLTVSMSPVILHLSVARSLDLRISRLFGTIPMAWCKFLGLLAICWLFRQTPDF